MTPFIRTIRDHWRIDAVGFAIMAGLALGVWFLQIEPTQRQGEVYAQREKDLQTQTARGAQEKSSLRIASDKLSASALLLAKSDMPLEPASSLNQRLARLTDLAIQNGLDIDRLEPGRPAVGAKYQTLPIRLAGRGTYANASRFLQQLHEKVPDSSVTAFTLSATPGGKDSPTFVFDILWYTAPARANAAASAAD